ncbi:hypothetical protein T10_6135, partial [Trichinella papuae]
LKMINHNINELKQLMDHIQENIFILSLHINLELLSLLGTRTGISEAHLDFLFAPFDFFCWHHQTVFMEFYQKRLPISICND